jgi:hypothetical protein
LKRSKGQKNSVRLSVTLDEGEYAELSELAASLDLSAAWMIRRAVSEFIARHRSGIDSDLPLRQPGDMPDDKGEKEKTK